MVIFFEEEMSIEAELSELTQELSIQHICDKAKQELGWSDDDAAYAMKWYARHWYLAKKYPDTHLAAISGKADELWHQHIIDMPKYSADSNRILGSIMEHQPIYGEPSEHQLEVHRATEQLYLEVFGELPDDLRTTSGDYSYALPRVISASDVLLRKAILA